MNYEQRLNDKQRQRFAFMLKQLREDRGLTITELADKLGYSIASISYWENKKNKSYFIQSTGCG